MWTERVSRAGTADWYWDEEGLDKFDGDKLCDKNLLFVGDSLTQHTYLSFLVQLGALDHYPKPKRVKSHKMNQTVILNEDCVIQLTYRRNDWMVLNDVPLSYKHVNANEPWKHLVEPADVVIMNQGAHFLQEHNFTTNVARALEFLENKRVLYLSVPPGYPNCMTHRTPVNTPPTSTGRTTTGM